MKEGGYIPQREFSGIKNLCKSRIGKFRNIIKNLDKIVKKPTPNADVPLAQR